MFSVILSAFHKKVLACKTEGALKIFGYILPFGSGSYAPLRVSLNLVIFPAASVANISHIQILLFS